jgi:hypothetical protein
MSMADEQKLSVSVVKSFRQPFSKGCGLSGQRPDSLSI